jgi:hypothetical protein
VPVEAVMQQSTTVPLRRWWTWQFWSRAALPEVVPEEKADEAVLSAVLAEPPGCERRGAIRHLCGRLTRCRFISLFQCPPWSAVIRDISTTGIGLVINEPPAPGTFLAIDLSDRRRVGAQVVAVCSQGSAGWLVGCVLLRRLTDDEVVDLL